LGALCRRRERFCKPLAGRVCSSQTDGANLHSLPYHATRAVILLAVSHRSANEIEIKLAAADLAAIRHRLRDLGARRGSRLHEANLLFDTPESSLRRRDMLLRVRVERRAKRITPSVTREERIALLDSWMFPPRRAQGAIVTLKGPTQYTAPADGAPTESAGRAERANYKIRREIEFEASDASAVREILEVLGFRPAFYYEKLRTTYRVRGFGNLLVSLDETPAGTFLELEGHPKSIDRAREALGYRPEDAILLSYGALYAAYRRAAGLPMTDMLFVRER